MSKSDAQADIEEAVAKNNEEWEKRLLLMIMIMMIALLGLE
jgi:hypothetical protein